MIVIQGRRGADVLAYSESLESVSYTSTSTEVWRSLGYWLTYVRDAYAPTTTAGRDYMVSGRLIATGFALLLVGLAGLVLTRWQERRFAVALVVTGVVLGVGVHPIDDPSPLMDLLLGDGTSGAALALRSSTRAVPMLMLGLALGAGALADAMAPLRLAGRVSWRPLAATAVGLLARRQPPGAHGAPPRRPGDRPRPGPAGRLVRRPPPPSTPPTPAGACSSCPGQEFGAFRWGYTVDPPLPGMIDRPLVTRDLLPLGSAAAMDLLYALDDRFQSGTVEPATIAPIARLLGADTGVAVRRRRLRPLPDAAPGDRPRPLRRRRAGPRAPAVPYGDPVVNRPDDADGRRAVGRRPAGRRSRSRPSSWSRVDDPAIRDPGQGRRRARRRQRRRARRRRCRRPPRRPRAGALHRLARARRPADAPPSSASAIIVTDSNRGRAHHWRGSQDVVGFTEDDEPDEPDVLGDDAADERLPVFGAGDERRADRRRAGWCGAGAGDGLRRAVRLPARGPPCHGRRRRSGHGMAGRRPLRRRSASRSASTSPSRSIT